jgi:TetR/AcrR family transcriptional repressor of nem operon
MARPITYDEDAVIAAALNQFWAEGFNRSSVDTLVDGTGLNKHSLYQAFGGKSGLFLRALERYLERQSLRYLAVFEQRRGMAALHGYFDAVLRKPDPRGCLVANTAVELGESDPDSQRLITGYYNRLADCFAKAIDDGQQDGDIRADLDARDTAAWLVRAMQGLAVSTRLGTRQLPNAKAILALLATDTTQ